MKALILAASALLLFGCGPDFTEAGLGTKINFTPNRPELPNPTTAPSYTGSDPYVVEAQERYRTGLDVHRKIVWRTCTPNDGVCHNQKEYPDLHTPANFVASINAPCNVQPGEPESVYDRCERPGDRFRFRRDDFGPAIEVAWIQNITGEQSEDGDEITTRSQGFHVELRSPVRTDRNEIYSMGQFIRTTENDGDIVFAQFETRWYILEGGTHLVAQVRNFQNDRAAELARVGIREGDANRNGIFGADENTVVKMIEPGNPEESYLIARVRGEMLGERVPGSRMPLANQPLNISEMLALFCFVEGIPADGRIDLASPVNYKECSYSEDPGSLNLLGEGVTWSSRVSKILEANCGGCHNSVAPDADLDLLSETAYERLLEASAQKPDLKLVEPGDYERSYLWHKLVRDPDIVGLPMPYNPLTGEGSLTQAELGDIQTWIANGAIKDE